MSNSVDPDETAHIYIINIFELLQSCAQPSICSVIVTFPGPSCSKLTTSLVNDSLNFTSSDTQIC